MDLERQIGVWYYRAGSRKEMPREGTCVSKGTKARKHEAHLEENNELLFEVEVLGSQVGRA